MGNWFENKSKGILKRIGFVKNNKNKEALRIKALRIKQESDAVRWSRQDVFHQNWKERTLILSKFIKDNCSVVEFGAGNAILKDNLNASIRYQPVDVVKRTEAFMVYDLNSSPFTFDLTPYDIVIFSGVLEYVYTIETVFEELSKCISTVLMSYACSDVCSKDRLTNGWLSDYSVSQLETIFGTYGYKIHHSQMWRDQNIFVLLKQ